MAEDTKTEMAVSKSMIAAGIAQIGGGSTFNQRDRIETAVRVYRAMLAARPSADQAEGVDDETDPSLPGMDWVLSEEAKMEIEELDRFQRSPGTDPAIARLREELAESIALCAKRLDNQISAEKRWLAALDQRDADIAKAVEALEPFEDIDTPGHDDAVPDDEVVAVYFGEQGKGPHISCFTVLVGDFRRARSVAAALRASSATQADGGGK